MKEFFNIWALKCFDLFTLIFNVLWCIQKNKTLIAETNVLPLVLPEAAPYLEQPDRHSIRASN